MCHASYEATHQGKKYTVYLDANTGEALGFFVHDLDADGKPKLQSLWAKAGGEPMPANLAAILTNQETPTVKAADLQFGDVIAYGTRRAVFVRPAVLLRQPGKQPVIILVEGTNEVLAVHIPDEVEVLSRQPVAEVAA